MTTMYAYLLGAYPTAAEFYAEAPFLFPLVNNTAIWIFSLSNLLFLIGMAGVYYLDRLLKRWLALTGTVISVFGLVGMTALFLELVSFGQIVAVGPFGGELSEEQAIELRKGLLENNREWLVFE